MKTNEEQSKELKEQEKEQESNAGQDDKLLVRGTAIPIKVCFNNFNFKNNMYTI